MPDIPFTIDSDALAPPEAGDVVTPKASRKAEQKPALKAPNSAGQKTEEALKAEEGSEDKTDPAEEEVLTVSRLTRQIRQLLEGRFGTLLVEGELSNLRAAASGHLYFALKDEGAQIRCVMFRNAAASLRFEPEDGLQVRVRAKVSVYEARGEYQLQVLGLEPQGAGALQLAFEQLKRRLEAEGLFDPSRKRPLPFLPRRIGLVTSAQGAALRDILNVLARRFPGLPVLIHPAAVQGDAAPGEIATGIATLNRLAIAQHIDVLIVGRGGGSIEDLWAFNTEPVARAIAASEVPVISAVGHEIDFTIADFVADLRAPTPSAAAELAVPNRADLLHTVQGLRSQLLNRLLSTLRLRSERWWSLRARLGSPEGAIRQFQQRIDDQRERLEQASRQRLHQAAQQSAQYHLRLRTARPDRFHPMHRALLAQLRERLHPALNRGLAQMRERVASQVELLDSLSPLTVLKRGYAVTSRPDGDVLRSVVGIKRGDRLRLRLQDGEVDSDVTAIRPHKDS
mgnify:CR=1 FL=1